MDTNKRSHFQSRQNNRDSLHTRSCCIQHTTCTTNKQHHTSREHKPKNTRTALYPKLTYNKDIDNTTTKVRQTIQILNALTSTTWGNKRKWYPQHNKTHSGVRFHYMVTTSIRHKHQQTTDNTEHRTQECNWVYKRHQHTRSTRRNTHITYKRTPPSTRITNKTKITTPPHHNSAP